MRNAAIGFLLVLLCTGVSAAADTAAVTAEGKKLYIYSAVDATLSATVAREFERLHPDIRVDIVTTGGSDLFTRYMNDLGGRRVSADILWSGEIALQAALLKDGYSLKHQAAADGPLMASSTIAESLHVVGFEPVVLVYNRKLLAGKEVPATRQALVKLLGDDLWKGRLGACDPEKSSMAYLLLTQDSVYHPQFRALARAFGKSGVKFYPDYQSLLDHTASGQITAAYSVPLSEVLRRRDRDETLAWTFTTDYTLAIPQTVLISRHATHPETARLWIDFIRSAAAQQLISGGSDLYPVRSDVAGGEMKRLGGALPPERSLRLIGADVARFSVAGLKKGFLLRWRQLLQTDK